MIATTVTDSARRANRTRSIEILIAIVALSLAGSFWLFAQGPASGGYFVPGDAKAGLKSFFDRGCARCHSVLGEGGQSAPDLARAPGGHLSASGLVSAVWNHAPAMWERMDEAQVALPNLSEEEMTNLFAFIYSVRSMDEPGNSERGRQLLSERGCISCHAVSGRGGKMGPDLRRWATYRNPVSWIQAMWNHAPQMQVLMEQRGLRWPEFTGSDVADLIAYIRTQATNPRRHVYLKPADPASGRNVFRRKGCATCHSLRGRAGSGPDLGRRDFPRTLGEFAARMWNHSPGMWATMQAQDIPRPQFSNKEMADLIAYLFAQRYFEASGNRLRGGRVFEVKGCATCHLPAGEGLGPDLGVWRGRVTPVALATAMWNHGPVMLKTMRQQNLPWPAFQPSEMVDLMEFLNQGARVQTSRRSEP